MKLVFDLFPHKLYCPHMNNTRTARLMPNGIPRYARCYDNGGTSADRYTVIFSGRAAKMRAPGYADQWPYLAMSESPYHPQGVGMHGHTDNFPADVNKWGFAPAIGRKCHLGRRIAFSALPADCQKAALADYKDIWKL